MMNREPARFEAAPASCEQAEEPRDWTRVGILLALQPLSWRLGLDWSQWHALSIDVGPLRFTVAWP
jgi:hypothetical protein